MAASSAFPFPSSCTSSSNPNPQPTTGSAAPPQRLLLAFPSHDVTLTGYRLHLLCEWLNQQKAMRLKAEDARFANLHPSQPFIASIGVSQSAPA